MTFTSLVGARNQMTRADARDEAGPVAEQDQEEEGGEQRDVGLGPRAAQRHGEVLERLEDPLGHVLAAAGDHPSRRGPSSQNETITTTATIHSVSSVDEMLTSNTTRPGGVWWPGGIHRVGCRQLQVAVDEADGVDALGGHAALGHRVERGDDEEREDVDDDDGGEHQQDAVAAAHRPAPSTQVSRVTFPPSSGAAIGHASSVPVPWPVSPTASGTVLPGGGSRTPPVPAPARKPTRMKSGRVPSSWSTQ